MEQNTVKNKPIIKKRALIPSIVAIDLAVIWLVLLFIGSTPIAIAALVFLCITVLYYFTGCCQWIYTPENKKIKKHDLYYSPQDVSRIREMIAKNNLNGLETLHRNSQGGTRLNLWTSKDNTLVLAQLYTYVPHTFVEATPLTPVKWDHISY